MKRFPACLIFLLASASVCAQSSSNRSVPRGFIARWMARASATQARQPAWAVPLITTTTGLIQVFRTDFVRQITSTGTQTWNLDNSKGVNVIPWANTEIDADFPPIFCTTPPQATAWGICRSRASTASRPATLSMATTT